MVFIVVVGVIMHLLLVEKRVRAAGYLVLLNDRRNLYIESTYNLSNGFFRACEDYSGGWNQTDFNYICSFSIFCLYLMQITVSDISVAVSSMCTKYVSSVSEFSY